MTSLLGTKQYCQTDTNILNSKINVAPVQQDSALLTIAVKNSSVVRRITYLTVIFHGQFYLVGGGECVPV